MSRKKGDSRRRVPAADQRWADAYDAELERIYIRKSWHADPDAPKCPECHLESGSRHPEYGYWLCANCWCIYDDLAEEIPSMFISQAMNQELDLYDAPGVTLKKSEVVQFLPSAS